MKLFNFKNEIEQKHGRGVQVHKAPGELPGKMTVYRLHELQVEVRGIDGTGILLHADDRPPCPELILRIIIAFTVKGDPFPDLFCDFLKGMGEPPERIPSPLRLINQIEQALAMRRSVSQFTNEALKPTQISQLAWAGQGITETQRGLRTAASIGGIYPIDLIFATHEGTFAYNPAEHRLEQISDQDIRITSLLTNTLLFERTLHFWHLMDLMKHYHIYSYHISSPFLQGRDLRSGPRN